MFLIRMQIKWRFVFLGSVPTKGNFNYLDALYGKENSF